MRKILLSLSAIALVAFVSCSKTEAPRTPEQTGPKISFQGSTSSSKAGMASDAVDGNYQFEWMANDQITIWYTVDGGSSFSGPGIYGVTESGPSSPFEYVSGTELTWDGVSSDYKFVAMYPNPTISTPSPVYNASSNAISIGTNGSIIDNSSLNMTQPVVNIPGHITGARSVMRAMTDVTAPADEETVTEAVNLNFEHGFAYFEFRMSGTDDGSGRKVASISVTSSDGSVKILPAGDANRYDPWTNTFPDYYMKTAFNVVFGTPFDVSETVQKAWAPFVPGNYTAKTLMFSVNYTSGPSTIIAKDGINITAGQLQPVVLDITPPENIVPTYTLTVLSTQTTAQAVAAAITAGDITAPSQVKEVIYQRTAYEATLASLINQGGVDTITFTALTILDQSLKNCTSLKYISFTGPITTLYSNAFDGCTHLQVLDFGTNIATTFTTWYVIPTAATNPGPITVKFGNASAFTNWNMDFFYNRAASVDLFLGAGDMANVDGTTWTTNGKTATFNSVTAY